MTRGNYRIRTVMAAAAVALGCAWPYPSQAQSVSTLPDGPRTTEDKLKSVTREVDCDVWTYLVGATELQSRGQYLA
jgi:hypothetical protein